MDKISFWQFLERIGNNGFIQNSYFYISKKDRIKLRLIKICNGLFFVAIFTFSSLVEAIYRNKVLSVFVIFLGLTFDLLITYLFYYLVYKKAHIITFERHFEIVTSKISFWRYFKYTRGLGLTENNIYDISSNDKKKIFIVNLCGFIFIFAFSIFIVFVLESVDIVIFYGILILAAIIEQLITLPFHYKIYKNIEITEFNKYADDSIFS